MKYVGIIFAMDEELDEFLKLVKCVNKYDIFDLTFYDVSVNENINCVLVKSGVGKVNAARCCQILIDNIKVDYVFNIGVAGGISDRLKVGDVVIGEKLIQHDFDITAFNHEKGYIPNVGTYIDSDKYLVSLAENSISNAISGVIASGDIFCTELKMSRKINDKFNALCVEMEGAAIAQVCYLSNIPFLILRSISDTPNDNNVVTYEEFLESSSKLIAISMKKILEKLGKEHF